MGRVDPHNPPNAPLPLWESWLYIGSWIAIASSLMFALYETSRDYAEHRDVSYDLDVGWSFLGRQKDITDAEWEFWRDSIFGVLGKWLLGHVVLSQLLRCQAVFDKRKNFLLVYSLLFYICVVGFGPMILIFIETLSIFSLAWFTSSPLIVWAMTLTFLMILNFESLRGPLLTLGLLQRGSFHVFYFQEFTLCMAVLRLTSFGLCYCDSRKRAQELVISSADQGMAEERPQKLATASDYVMTENGPQKLVTSSNPKLFNTEGGSCHQYKIIRISACKQKPSDTMTEDKQTSSAAENFPISGSATAQLVDLFFYVFYLPLFVAGPMMNYDVFYTQFNHSLERWSFYRLKPVAVGLFRFLVWGFSYEFLQHYFYSGALIHKPTLLAVLPLWAAAGTGYAYGMFFVVKYVVIWALCAAVSRLDQLDPPDVPSCGSHIYLYSKMWKTFDRGLYAFLKQHIYILLGGSRHGLVRRMVALLACFGFIAVWHGLHSYIIVWCFFNFFAVLLEAAAGSLASSPAVRNFEVKHLSPAMVRRLHAFLIIPVLGVSTFSLVAFFAGLETAYVLFYRLIVEGFPVSVILVTFSLYCVIQTGKEVENYQAMHHQHHSVKAD